jgi:hypothetical protein
MKYSFKLMMTICNALDMSIASFIFFLLSNRTFFLT